MKIQDVQVHLTTRKLYGDLASLHPHILAAEASRAGMLDDAGSNILRQHSS